MELVGELAGVPGEGFLRATAIVVVDRLVGGKIPQKKMPAYERFRVRTSDMVPKQSLITDEVERQDGRKRCLRASGENEPGKLARKIDPFR